MKLQLVQHPLIEQALHGLRDKTTPSALFKQYCHQVTLPLLLEATRDLPLQQTSVETPLETTVTRVLASQPVWVPVLRAGLGMLKVAQELFPDAEVGHIGLERDESTALARTYYQKLPPLEGRTVLVIDPMLATGGSAVHALDFVKKAGAAARVKLVCIVAAPEGVLAVNDYHPDVEIVCSALDRQLNDRAYILPGLGDFGDRYFNT